ncbi:MAG TPA: hypothetical protein VME19_08025 [Streptosporangiaceae bacterium]|nr:hypothetical protein [Streptosporangiaceae bacterium]
MRVVIAVIGAMVTAASLAACGTAAAPRAAGPDLHTAGATLTGAVPGPAAGSRAEATALAQELLSRLRLPAGTRRLPATPLPAPVSDAFAAPGGPDDLNLHQLFAVAQPLDALAAVMAARVPAGLSLSGTGSGWDRDVETMREVEYAPRSVPASIYSARLVLTLVPATSGGSLLLADAQVIWYPSRTAAEYIDPARYHVLTVTVTLSGRGTHTMRRVVTSRAVISQLARALNASQAEPALVLNCPLIFADYQLALAVSRTGRPVVVVSATRWPCGGSRIAVDGRAQPPLADNGAVVAIADRVLGTNPQP